MSFLLRLVFVTVAIISHQFNVLSLRSDSFVFRAGENILVKLIP